MCNCTKKIPKTGPQVSGNSIMNGISGLRSLSNSDLVTRYYIGETGEYVGSVTGINYSTRTYNKLTMVHSQDLEADHHLFSDTMQVETRSVDETIDEDVTHDLAFFDANGEIIEDAVSKPRRSRSKKAKDEEANGESL